MIRLNDKDNSRINEKGINFYWSQNEIGLPVITMVICGNIENLYYNNEQLRDKDIELLDKLFDVKSIEDRVEERGEENKLEHSCKPEEDEHIPFEEKYITFDEVVEKTSKEPNSQLWGRLPNDKKVVLKYNPVKDVICLISPYGNMTSGEIYDNDLFNALKLKRVE